MKRRIFSIAIALCLMLSSMPGIAFAETDGSSGGGGSAPSVSAFASRTQLTDETFKPNIEGKASVKGKLKFGKNLRGESIEWYILGDDKSIDGEDTILFCSGEIANDSYFNSQTGDMTYDSSWGCSYPSSAPSSVYANFYGGSTLRNELKSNETEYFNSIEHGMMSETTLLHYDSKNKSHYNTTDKLYVPYTYSDDILRVGSTYHRFICMNDYWNTGDIFWISSNFEGSGMVAMFASPGQGLGQFTVSTSLQVRPATDISLSSVLFASSASGAYSDAAAYGTLEADEKGEPKAMTLRLDGSSKNLGRASYDVSTGTVRATKGSFAGNVALVVQGNDGTTDWYYSKKITGTSSIDASDIKSALGLSSSIDLSSCKIWLEASQNDMLYAVETDSCVNEADLLESVSSGASSVSLAEDITLSGTLDLSDRNIELDLNGHTLKGDIRLSDTSAEPESVLTLSDGNPSGGGVVNGKITLTRDNGSSSTLYANGGTVTGQVSLPSYAGRIYCTSSTPTVFKGNVGNYGEIHGGIFYGSVKEDCIKEKAVKFMNGDSIYATQVVESGLKVSAPAEPAKTGCRFLGWYNGEALYDFSKAVTENLTLTAKWAKETASTEADLKEAVASGSKSIKLLNDITLSEPLDLSKMTVTIDLNGYVISGKSISISTDKGAANLTLVDSRPAAAHSDSTLPKGGVVKSEIAMNRNADAYNSCVLYANGGTVVSNFSSNTNNVSIKCTGATPSVFTGNVSGYPHLFAGIYYGTISSNVTIEGVKATFRSDNKDYAYEVITSGGKLIEPASPAIPTGYRSFGGWYNGNTKYSFGSALSGNITLTAKFADPITYKISYDLGGGTADNPAGYTVESEAFTLKNPVKTAYTFSGWSGTGLDGSDNKTVTIPKGSTGERSYTAHFTENSYSVSFDTDGGSTVAGRTDVRWNDKVLSGIGVPSKAGYEFNGWKCGDKQVTADTTYSDLAIKDTVTEITITAQWSDPIEYKLSYDLGGGAADNPAGYTVESEPFTLKNPVRTAYTFTGWSGTGLNGDSNKTVTIPKGSTGDRSYKAHFTENIYTIVVDTNGGSTVAGRADVRWNDKVLSGIGVPSKAGYEFNGWKCGDKQVNADTTYSELAGKDTVTEIMISAQWKEHRYTEEIISDETLKTPADCTHDAEYYLSCSCGEISESETFMARGTALGHRKTHDETKNLVPATTGAAGSYDIVSICDDCGAETASTRMQIPRIGTVSLSKTGYIYNGTGQVPSLTIKDVDGRILEPGTDYTTSGLTKRTSVGRYKVTVTFKGDRYSGNKDLYFSINPKGTSIYKVSGAKKAFTVKWKRQSTKMAASRITGYQVRYSTSSKMTSAKIKTVKGYRYTSKKITRLKAKKKYYVQVRTYKIVSGRTFYSAWSGAKKVRTR